MSQVDPIPASDYAPATHVDAGHINPLDLEDVAGKNVDPDCPPESFWLSKDAEFDWFDRNAFYERKDSTRGPTSIPTNLNPSAVHSSTSNPQRLPNTPLKSKASIIGLPKTQKQRFSVDLSNKNRRNQRPGSWHLFPKQNESVRKLRPSLSSAPAEPSSPKVSCMGKVGSNKDSRSKSAFLSTLKAMFTSGCRQGRATAVHAPTGESPARGSTSAGDIRKRLPAADAGKRSEDLVPRRSSVEGEPPGLGGMARFASGWRSSSWVQAEE